MWTPEQIAEIYGKHSFSVHRRCLRLLGDEEEARDMTQEVFVRALKKPDAFRGQSSVATFLYAIATNLCLNRIRNTRARGEQWQDQVTELMESKGPSGTHALVEAKEIARAILSQTDETTATIAVCHFVDGLSQKEIGKLVGLSRVSVNQKLKRFREQAKAYMEKEP